VQVPAPGEEEVEGKRKGNCVAARRGGEEVQRESVSRDLAWNTSKSAHGPWRISMSPALSMALPTQYFVELGLPLLHT